jgi:DUF971 family protein
MAELKPKSGLNGAPAVLYDPKCVSRRSLLLLASRARLLILSVSAGELGCAPPLRIKSATMALGKSKTPPQIRGLNEVGRYAIGIQWADGHDSIFPLENLRRGCPCNVCVGAVEGELPPTAQRLLHLSRLGGAAVYLEWIDGHETLYTTSQLRQICRCALCVQEPERPITGS